MELIGLTGTKYQLDLKPLISGGEGSIYLVTDEGDDKVEKDYEKTIHRDTTSVKQGRAGVQNKLKSSKSIILGNAGVQKRKRFRATVDIVFGLLIVLVLSQSACGEILPSSDGELLSDTELKALLTMAMQGNAKAQYDLGYRYERAYGVEQDYGRAVYWYTKAAEQWHVEAEYRLRDLRDRFGDFGENSASKTDTKVSPTFTPRNTPTPKATITPTITQRTFDNYNFSLDSNDKEFQDWLAWAAKGDIIAHHNLGWCYKTGQKVAQDRQKALYWYTKAAEQGDAEAQNEVGTFYSTGKGGEQDHEKAVYWFTKAAEQGEIYAQANLGWCYENGAGVEQDYQKAIYWYTKSAEHGNGMAKSALKNLGVLTT